jgi:hypothetical protein
MGGQSQLITHRRAGRLWKIYAHRDPFQEVTLPSYSDDEVDHLKVVLGTSMKVWD